MHVLAQSSKSSNRNRHIPANDPWRMAVTQTAENHWLMQVTSTKEGITGCSISTANMAQEVITIKPRYRGALTLRIIAGLSFRTASQLSSRATEQNRKLQQSVLKQDAVIEISLADTHCRADHVKSNSVPRSHAQSPNRHICFT